MQHDGRWRQGAVLLESLPSLEVTRRRRGRGRRRTRPQPRDERSPTPSCPRGSRARARIRPQVSPTSHRSQTSFLREGSANCQVRVTRMSTRSCCLSPLTRHFFAFALPRWWICPDQCHLRVNAWVTQHQMSFAAARNPRRRAVGQAAMFPPTPALLSAIVGVDSFICTFLPKPQRALLSTEVGQRDRSMFGRSKAICDCTLQCVVIPHARFPRRDHARTGSGCARVAS